MCRSILRAYLVQGNASSGGQQQGAEDVLPKRHTMSRNKVKIRLNTLTLPSCHAVSTNTYVCNLHCIGCVARGHPA